MTVNQFYVYIKSQELVEGYSYFPRFIFRTPILDNNEYLNKDFINTELFEESVAISSKSLRNHLKEEKDKGKKYSEKLTNALTKYLIRMSTRSTPLGIFAGLGVGDIKNETNFDLKGEDFRAVSTLTYVVCDAVLAKFNKQEKVRLGQSYSVNTSLFKFGESFRFNERTSENTFKLNEVEHEDFIHDIIEACNTRPSGYELGNLVVDLKYADTQEEALEFIDLLIDNQLIIGELSLSLTKKNYYHFILEKLKSLSISESELLPLREINNRLLEIDKQPIGKKENLLTVLETSIYELFPDYDFKEKRIINTNLTIKANDVSISRLLADEITKGLSCLVSLNLIRNEFSPLISEFKTKFRARYEDEYIPLLEALDPDIGIGFGQFNETSIYKDSIVGHFNLGGTSQNPENEYPNPVLIKKYQQFLKNGEDNIIITDEDLKEYANTEPRLLPVTFLAGIEVYQADKQPLFYIKFAGGTSAANLLSRFCESNDEVDEMARSLVEVEKRHLSEECVFAEISYLTEHLDSSIILARPLLHEYEIPFMNQASASIEGTILPSDLVISVDINNQIILKSKKLNKKVIPKNTTAHDYSYKTNPLYYFLSSLQVPEATRFRFGLDWENVNSVDGYFPRVMYKESTILIPARWYVSRIEIMDHLGFMMTTKKARGIPDKVVLFKGADMKILIDFSQDHSMDILKSELGESKVVILEEYLFGNASALITSNGAAHNNEIFLSYIKN